LEVAKSRCREEERQDVEELFFDPRRFVMAEKKMLQKVKRVKTLN